MTWRKRVRVLWAAVSQQWHEKTCAECGGKSLAVGTPTDLIFICDACELEEMDRFTAAMERQYQDQLKGAI